MSSTPFLVSVMPHRVEVSGQYEKAFSTSSIRLYGVQSGGRNYHIWPCCSLAIELSMKEIVQLVLLSSMFATHLYMHSLNHSCAHTESEFILP